MYNMTSFGLCANFNVTFSAAFTPVLTRASKDAQTNERVNDLIFIKKLPVEEWKLVDI